MITSTTLHQLLGSFERKLLSLRQQVLLNVLYVAQMVSEYILMSRFFFKDVTTGQIVKGRSAHMDVPHHHSWINISLLHLVSGVV